MVRVRRPRGEGDATAAAPAALGTCCWVSRVEADERAATSAARDIACDVLQRRLLAFLRQSTSLVYSVCCQKEPSEEEP